MAQPASRVDLINYCKRQLGAPVLEINVADEQLDDLVDDALQLFHERDYDGSIQTFLKYKITQADIDRGRARGGDNPVGIVEKWWEEPGINNDGSDNDPYGETMPEKCLEYLAGNC